MVDEQSRRATSCRPIQRHPERHPPWSHPICRRGDEKLDGGDGKGGRRCRPNGASGRIRGNGAASLRTFGPASPNRLALPHHCVSPRSNGRSLQGGLAQRARSHRAWPTVAEPTWRRADDPASHPRKTLNTAARGPPLRLRAVRAGTGRGRRPLAPRLRLSGAYGAVWWDCDPFVAPARLPLRHREIAVVLSSVLANEVAPRRASSPP